MHCGTQSKWQPLGQPVLYCFWFLWISRHDLFFFNVYLAVYIVYKTTGSRSKDRIYSKPEGQSTLTYSFLLFSHLLVLFAQTEHSVSDRNACVSDLLVKGSFSYGLGSWKNGLACWTVAEFVFCSLLAFFFFHWLMVVCFSTLANPVGFLTCWLLTWFAGTRCTAPVAAVKSGWQSMDWCSMIMILMWRTAPRNRRRYWLMHDIQHSKVNFFSDLFSILLLILQTFMQNSFGLVFLKLLTWLSCASCTLGEVTKSVSSEVAFGKLTLFGMAYIAAFCLKHIIFWTELYS